MPLLTQAKAKETLRAETGRSVEWCEATVRGMKKTQDGLRFKVSTYQIEKAITAKTASRQRCARLAAGSRRCKIKLATAEKAYGMIRVSVAISTINVYAATNPREKLKISSRLARVPIST